MGTMRIIDSAMRIPLDLNGFEIQDYLKRMDRFDVSMAVIAPPEAYVAVYNQEGNEFMSSLSKLYPLRIRGLAVANPWYGDKALQTLRQAFDNDLAGLYLCAYRQGFRLTESIIDPLIKVCQEYNKPVYCYMSTPGCAMPFQLAELARRFPQVDFIMGHFGFVDFADYDAIPAARQASNIFIETSCVWGGLVSNAVSELGADRLLFASGYPRSSLAVEIRKIDDLKLNAESQDKILWGNARRVWRLS